MSTTQTEDDSATRHVIDLCGGLAAELSPCESGGVHVTVKAEGWHVATGAVRVIVESAAVAERGELKGGGRVTTRSRADVGPTLFTPDRATANLLADHINELAARTRNDAIAP